MGQLMKGINVDELLAWNEKLHSMEKSIIDEAPGKVDEAGVMPEAEFDEVAYIKDIERDFSLQAEELLVTMQLSHLLVAPKMRP